jgi:regulatory protein
LEGPPPPAQTDRERAVQLAYQAIGRREHTVAELRGRLERRRVGPAEIDEAVSELEDAGFLDDARYARQFVEDRRTLDRWGSERIERDLRRRGVERELVERALAGVERQSELESALALLDERFRSAPEDDRARDRAWKLLVRRGYEPELAYEAVREHARRTAD